VQSTATSSTLSLPFADSVQLSPAKYSPSDGAGLASHLSDAINVTPLASATLAPAGSSFIQSVGFYALWPILAYTDHQYTCTATDAHGNINLAVDTHFIYALRRYPRNAAPHWTTSLVSRAFLMRDDIIKAMSGAVPLPTYRLEWGGGTAF